MEFKSQICTDLNQSRKLLELGLKKETADMYITNMSSKGLNYTDDWQIGTISYCNAMSFWDSKGLQLEKTAWSIIPAWSLHRLIEMYTERYLACSVNLKIFTYEWLINEIEIHIKEGDFNKDYLEENNESKSFEKR